MSGVDYCITTMDRPQALERLLHSVARHQPGAEIHIADQSAEFDTTRHRALANRLAEAGLRKPPVVHRMPFDCGVSAARNHLMNVTPSRYKLLLDDDFAFTAETDVLAMAGLLDAYPSAGAVGGAVKRGGRVRHAGSLLRRDGDSLDQDPVQGEFDSHRGIRIRHADCVPMFMLVRGDIAKHVRWDPALKTAAEHLDFFLRLRDSPYTVLYTPDSAIDHPPIESSLSYQELRLRSDLLHRMLEKHGLRRLRMASGTTAEIRPDGELVRFCELRPEAARSGH